VTRPPCIVCGKRRGHDAETHDAVRLERRRCANLLRKTWPRLPGLPKVLDFYRRQEPPPKPTTERRPIDWCVKVLRSGDVIHLPVYEREETEA